MSVCKVTGRSTLMARDLLGQDKPFSLWDQTDASLVELRRHHLRNAADLARRGEIRRAHREWFMAREIREHQLSRFRLRMRYGAVDDHQGTTSWDCYMRHDEPPGYTLALAIDSGRARIGRPHVLAWEAAVTP